MIVICCRFGRLARVRSLGTVCLLLNCMRVNLVNSESHHADGCKTAAFLSKELRGGGRKRRVYMEECENLSDWEDEPLLPSSIRNS